jgi:hypothetical protein
MSRRLSDREHEVLLAAQAGRLFQSRRTGRYAEKVRGLVKGRSPNTAARALRAGGLLTVAAIDGPAGVLTVRVVPTPMGLLAIEREGLEREVEAAA